MFRPILFAVAVFAASVAAVELIDQSFRKREEELLTKRLAGK